MVSGGQSLADYYVDDNLDYDYLDHSQFGLHEPDFDTALLDRESEDVEPDDLRVLPHICLACRLRPFCAVIWGTCIALKMQSHARQTLSRGGDHRSVHGCLQTLASVAIRPGSLFLPFRVRIYASRFDAPVSADASAGVWCVSFRGR